MTERDILESHDIAEPQITSGDMTLGTWVKLRRKSLGMQRPRDLAKRMTDLGEGFIDPGYVSQLEIGRISLPHQPKLNQLAQVLDCSEAYILRRAGLITEPCDPANPFERGDPRHDIVKMLAGLDDVAAEFYRGQLEWVYNRYYKPQTEK